MNINSQLDDLFEQWKMHSACAEGIFIPDGHVDEEAWSGADLKLMVLLKEVNSSDGGGICSSLYVRRDISRKAVPGLHSFGGHMESYMDSRNTKRLSGVMQTLRKRLMRFSERSILPM